MAQRKFLVFGILVLAFLIPLQVNAQRGEKIQTVVIDAGHGGHDTGALGRYSKEKDINLDVALKLGSYIKSNFPDVKVVYTRTKDEYITLSGRAAIANRNNADVFISIHCNSTPKANSAHGAETFVMGEYKNEENLDVAKRENASILFEKDAGETYGDFDPNSTEAYIIFSLYQSEYQSQSLDLAEQVQKQICNFAGRSDRGVKQAGFLVLVRTSMPSILVELGFINDVNEERFLSSDEGQNKIASAIFRAFRAFKTAYEGKNTAKDSPNINDNTPVNTDDTVTKGKSEDVGKKQADVVTYKVQFASSDTRLSVNDKSFSKVKDVGMYEYNKAYRYTSGSFATSEEAMQRQAEMRKMGYKDAFVVAFVNGERATLKEADAARKR